MDHLWLIDEGSGLSSGPIFVGQERNEMRGICIFDNSDPEPLVAKFSQEMSSLGIYFTFNQHFQQGGRFYCFTTYDARNRQNLTHRQVQFDNCCSRLQEDAEPN